MSDANTPIQKLYDMVKNGTFDNNNNQPMGMNQQQMPMGGSGFQMNPQQNQWGNQPAMGQMNNNQMNQNMPMNNQNMFMNPGQFWGNNPQMNPNMMMQNPGMFYPYNQGFMPQQPMNPAMFQNNWQFQPNPVNPANPQPQQNNDNAQFWTLIFENKENGSRLNIQITDDKIVDEALSSYRKKTLDMNYLSFKFNGKPLNSNLRLSQSGLHNGAVITVEKMDPNSIPQNNMQPQTQFVNNNFGQQANFAQGQQQFYPAQNGNYNIIFEMKAGGQSITIQISPDKLVSDAINSFKNKMLYQGEMKFIFNGQNLDQNLTIQAAGLRNGAKILVIGTKDIEGA
jgi:hypothetical protein